MRPWMYCTDSETLCMCVFCQGWVLFFDSVFADACARCLQGRGEEIDGERWCRTLWYESPHQPQIHCLLLASNTIRHQCHQFLKGCDAHFTANIQGGKSFLRGRQWESRTTIATMRTHYSHRIHFPRGPSTPPITLLTGLIYAIDVWHSAAVQTLFSHIIYIGL